MIEKSPELNALADRYRAHGLLLKTDALDKRAYMKTFEVLGLRGVFHAALAASGAWDDFTASGTVYTNIFSVRRIYFLTEHDDLLSGTQFLIGPLNISIGFNR